MTIRTRDLVKVKHESGELKGTVLAIDDGMASIQIAPRFLLQVPESECEVIPPSTYYFIVKADSSIFDGAKFEVMQRYFGAVPHHSSDESPSFPERPEGMKP